MNIGLHKVVAARFSQSLNPEPLNREPLNREPLNREPLTDHRSPFTVQPPDRLALSHAEGPTARPANRPTGFTLLELLAVILIIAILLGIMTSAAQYVIKVARDKRLTMTCRTLESAMARYRHEYHAWPIPTGYAPVGNTGWVYRVSGANNREWFHLLRAEGNSDNPKKIRFVDETTIFTIATDGQRIPLHRAREQDASAQYPFVGVNRKGQTVYFSAEINVDADTVQVSAP
jgi:prepilin-type N-terminal cleavage/methylation domain-containing protein